MSASARTAITCVGLVLVALACSASERCGSGAACPGIGMYWASYQLNAEPHYRLIFEGGADGVSASELRIVDATGSVIGRAAVVRAESETLRLCGGGMPTKGSTPVPTYLPGIFGPLRSTVPVTDQVFRDFIKDSAKFTVEMHVASTWMRVIPTNLCHAQE